MNCSRVLVIFSGVISPTKNEAWTKKERSAFRKNLTGKITCNFDIFIYKGYTCELPCFLKNLKCRYSEINFVDLSYSSENSALLSNILTPEMYNNFYTNATSNLLDNFMKITYLSGIKNSHIYGSEPQDADRTLAVNKPNDLFSSDVVFHARYPTGPNNFKSFTINELLNSEGIFVHTQTTEELMATIRSSVDKAVSITNVNLFELASNLNEKCHKIVGRPLLLNDEKNIPTVYQILKLDHCDVERSEGFYLHQKNLGDFMWASGFYPLADGDFVFDKAVTAAQLLNRHFKY